ncbi:hypothetical protein MMC26_005692 [Xylographa opegraphella]|nr:hypothetical protein [Xylographa opegraphella]
MPGSPSNAAERDTKLPGMPARKRYVGATNAWAQDQALEAENNCGMENAWSLANPRDASTSGPSGDTGNNSSAVSYRQNNTSDAACEKISQATTVREKNSWAQEALSLNDVGKLLDENNHVQYTTGARVDTVENENEETAPANKLPKMKHAVGTFLPSNKQSKTGPLMEPTPSKPFSMTRKMSLKGLRNVLAGNKVVFDDSIAGKGLPNAPSVPSVRLDKASRVLGLNIQPDWQSGGHRQPLASAPDLGYPNLYRDRIFDREIPISIGPKANDFSTLTEKEKPQLPAKSSVSGRQSSRGEMESDGILLGHGNLSPTRSGSYGTVGNRDVVGASFGRIASQQWIIETMDNEGEDKGRGNQSPAGHLSSGVYSPSMYEGVWENHPDVGRSLPAFSPNLPNPKEYFELVDTKLESEDGAISPPGEGSDMGATYVPRSSVLTLASIISIATSLDEESTRQDSAEVLPLFAEDAEMSPVASVRDSTIPQTNAVPPPPSSFPGYQASAPIGFAHAMMEIHHHIETSNDRLQRLITDQNNRTHDELIRRCESLEEKIQRNGKGASKHDLNSLKNEFDILGHDLHVTATTGTETKRMIHTVLAKIAALDESLKNNSCKCCLSSPQRLDQEETPPRQTHNMFVNSHRPPNTTSSPGYIHVPVQYHGTQLAGFGNSNSYGSFSTPRFHNEPSTNPEPRPVEVTEEYYRALGHPQMMRAEIPETEIHEELKFFGKDLTCTIPFGIRGPNGVLYELPSFMGMTSKGPIIFDESPVSASTEGIGGLVIANNIESPNQQVPSTEPVGVDGPDGITYDLPSFMSYDGNGNIVLDHFDEDKSPVALSPNEHNATVIEDKDNVGGGQMAVAVGPVPTGIRMSNGVVYELPSFLHLNGDGQVEVVQDEEPSGAENGNAVPQNDHTPFGIRMDNNTVYEVPTFIHINQDGQPEIDVQDEVLTDNGYEVAASEGTAPVSTRGAMPALLSLLRSEDDGLEEIVQQGVSGNGQHDTYIPPTDWVPFGIRMDNGVLYELPSFMRINEEGLAEIHLQDKASADDQEVAGLPIGPVPIGIRGPTGVLYELPSFMRINEGLAEIHLQDETSADDQNVAALPVGPVPIGIRGPNGVLYELPSFMRINDDGIAEVVQQDEPVIEQNNPHMPSVGEVPIAIRMENGVNYEVPSFMHISEDG